MLPTEVEHNSFRVQHFNEEQSDDSRVDDLTRLEELREVAIIQSTKHQQDMRRYHAHYVSSHIFQVRDFILLLSHETNRNLKPLFEIAETGWPDFVGTGGIQGCHRAATRCFSSGQAVLG
jgi:hypothetical protein